MGEVNKKLYVVIDIYDNGKIDVHELHSGLRSQTNRREIKKNLNKENAKYLGAFVDDDGELQLFTNSVVEYESIDAFYENCVENAKQLQAGDRIYSVTTVYKHAIHVEYVIVKFSSTGMMFKSNSGKFQPYIQAAKTFDCTTANIEAYYLNTRCSTKKPFAALEYKVAKEMSESEDNQNKQTGM